MSNDHALRLDHQLCFAIYACSRELTKLYRPFLEEIGITYPQYLVLLVLWEQGETTMKELGKRLYLDSGTLTPMLKRMEENGLVQRLRSPEDERVVRIVLTEQGEKIKQKAQCIPEEIVKRVGLSNQEWSELLMLLRSLLVRLNDEQHSSWSNVPVLQSCPRQY
ncbi:MarR family transcriptional regulator [Geobacillus vulcani]